MKKFLNSFLILSLAILLLNGCDLLSKKETPKTTPPAQENVTEEEGKIDDGKKEEMEEMETEEEGTEEVETEGSEAEEKEEQRPSLPKRPEPPKITQIDLILDASGSMWGQIEGKSKIAIAKEVMGRIIDQLSEKENLLVGLRIYGHLNNECDNSVLEIPISEIKADEMKAMVNGIKPLGRTPITYSLKESAADFDKNIEGEKVVILVTDGIESCEGDPCAAAKALKEAGVVTKVHIVGFGLQEGELETLQCIAEPSDGIVVGANNADELTGAFDEIIKKTLAVNLEITGKNEQGDDVYMTVEAYKNSELIEKANGAMIQWLLPKGTYDIKATASDTGMVQWLKGIQVKEDELTQKEIIFAEGHIIIKGFDSENNPLGLYGYLFKADDEKNEMAIEGWGNEIEFKAEPGTYSIEVKNKDTDDILWFKDIEVKSGDTVIKEAKFAKALLTIKGFDANGDEISLYGNIFPAGDEKDRLGSDGWTTLLEFNMVPGTYSVEVSNDNTDEKKWIRDIVLEAGQTVEKELTFESSLLTIKGSDANGDEISLYGNIFPAGDEKNRLGSDGWTTLLEFNMVPGTYSVEVSNDNTDEKKWIRDIVLEAGQTVEKEISF